MVEFPFMDAQRKLEDAAEWLIDMTLPVGDEARHEDEDAICLEQAVAHMQAAAAALFDAGSQMVEVGVTVIDGYSVPDYQRECIDDEAVEAGKKIEALAAPLLEWQRTGVAVAITDEMATRIKAVVREGYKQRLDDELKEHERMSDMADAATC